MKWLSIIIAFVLLAGCSGKPPAIEKPITISARPVLRPVLNLPNVDRFHARDVQWRVITFDNVEEIFRELIESGKLPVLLALDENGYNNVVINTAELLRIIRQQQSVINGQKEYYIQADGIIREYNRSLDDS